MKTLTAFVVSFSFLASVGLHTGQALAEVNASAKQIVITAGSQASSKGSDKYFTGSVRVDPLFQAQAPTRAYAASVTFEPGARTAWHIHPLGQRLIVTSGVGLTQEWGGPIQEIKAGDVVICPPDVKHWHGAAAKTAMTHIAVGENMDGKSVQWMEKVSDEEYLDK